MLLQTTGGFVGVCLFILFLFSVSVLNKNWAGCIVYLPIYHWDVHFVFMLIFLRYTLYSLRRFSWITELKILIHQRSDLVQQHLVIEKYFLNGQQVPYPLLKPLEKSCMCGSWFWRNATNCEPILFIAGIFSAVNKIAHASF